MARSSTVGASDTTHTTHREQWTGQYGFILAAIGSAIGLGNIWRFPGVAYENGGGAFLIPYLAALLTAGIPILLLDYALGHRYRGSAPAVFRRISRKLEPLGWLQVGVCFVILTYYAVVLAWSTRFTLFSFDLAWGDDAQRFFLNDYLRVTEPHATADVVPGVFLPLVIVWLAVAFVVFRGVTRGLERANKIFLPLLVVMFLALVVRALFLPGAAEGLNAFFTPDWGQLTNPQVWLAAYGQIFFSLSVAFGIMITYSSYLRRRSNLSTTGFVTGFANSSFEILAGIGVFATLGFLAAQQNVAVGDLEGLTGPILSFVTFPTVISAMPGGPVFGVLFFGSLTLAGFTSLISVLQVVAAALQEKFAISRAAASVSASVAAGTLSVLLFSTTNGLNALDVVDKFVNELGIVAAAILSTVIVSWVVRRLPELRRHLNEVSTLKVGVWWYALVAVVNPVMLSAMFGAVLWTLISVGYDDYPDGFVAQFGWGTVAFLVAFSLVMSAFSWRTGVDLFDPVRFHDTPQPAKDSDRKGESR